MPVSEITVLEVGLDALLVRVPGTDIALALAKHLSEHWGQVVSDIVPAAETVLIDGVNGHAEQIRADIEGWTPRPSDLDGPEIRIPVRYNGADLPEVAAHWGVSIDEVVQRHTATLFVAAFTGFAPGFAYLSGTRWPVPRRAQPRTSVPAGSVALADRWCGVYPRATPGGWQLIGQTDAVLWDLNRPAPALLEPGTRVRFEAV